MGEKEKKDETTGIEEQYMDEEEKTEETHTKENKSHTLKVPPTASVS